MAVLFDRESGTFHLKNREISYIMKLLPNLQIGHLYLGKHIRREGSFDYLTEPSRRPMSSYVYEGDHDLSLEHVLQEYPVFGTGDYRHPAVSVRDQSGCLVTGFRYMGHEVVKGKPRLAGLPATYCEDEKEAETLRIFLADTVTEVKAELLYTIFAERAAIARSVRIINEGKSPVTAEQVMSLCLDLPDDDYEWLQLSGAWARECHIVKRKLSPGIQSVESTRGNSSHTHNPFAALLRPGTTEDAGEVIGFSLIYSGNFLAQAEVDSFGTTRFLMGLNPFDFSWVLSPGESLQLPEAVMVYSSEGLNGMSRIFHSLYRERLARGVWRDRERPILYNSWESMTFDLNEEKLLAQARCAAACGIELFVLDDGWFGERDSVRRGLGDWHKVRTCLPHGLSWLSERIQELGLKFGLWIEPEMVNRDSGLFRKHPDWILASPGRPLCHGRDELVLDLSRREVVDYLYDTLKRLFESADVSYVKWDMNRSITEAFSAGLPAERQGEVRHRYILGVYALYERLTEAFPDILFESCSSGGGRMDPGMLYYAPQCWISDDSDAAERLFIQYGTSLCYPLSSFGTHVSAVPNQQVHRITPLHTRANTAFFGTFGYEMDLLKLDKEELSQVKAQTAFMKKYRGLIQKGTFYRLLSPFENRHYAAWMVVSADKKTAIAGLYKLLNEVNGPYHTLKLQGLDPELCYSVEEIRIREGGGNAGTEDSISEADEMAARRCAYGGDELMQIGFVTSDSAAGELRENMKLSCDFDSRIFVLRPV